MKPNLRPTLSVADEAFAARVADASLADRAQLWPYPDSRRANARHALAIACPIVLALLGDEAFEVLTGRLLGHSPHGHADWGEWGEGLAACIEAQPELAHLGYLADVARLDWLCHVGERAQDTVLDGASLAMLGSQPPESLRLVLAHDIGLLSSVHPLVAVWHAHHAPPEEQPRWRAMANVPLPQGQRQHVLVHRRPWRAVPSALPQAMHVFMQAVHEGQSLAQALEAAEPFGFDFVQWLPHAIQQGWVAGLAEHPL